MMKGEDEEEEEVKEIAQALLSYLVLSPFKNFCHGAGGMAQR